MHTRERFMDVGRTEPRHAPRAHVQLLRTATSSRLGGGGAEKVDGLARQALQVAQGRAFGEANLREQSGLMGPCARAACRRAVSAGGTPGAGEARDRTASSRPASVRSATACVSSSSFSTLFRSSALVSCGTSALNGALAAAPASVPSSARRRPRASVAKASSACRRLRPQPPRQAIRDPGAATTTTRRTPED